MPTGHYLHKQKPRPIETPIGPSISYVPLTKGKYALIDSEDAEKVSFCPWFCRGEYPSGVVGGKIMALHKFIMGNPGNIVDHSNDNQLDCRKSNLRHASKLQNNVNRGRQINNTSGYKGVSLKKGYKDKKWRSTIGINGRTVTIGYFQTPEEAHSAYCEAAIKEFGEFANLG